MKKVAEFTGKKVQEAVEEGLKALGLSFDDAEIKIISNGGLFKKAKVEIHYDDGMTEEEYNRLVAEQAALKEREKEQAMLEQASDEMQEEAEEKTDEQEKPRFNSRRDNKRRDRKNGNGGYEGKEPKAEKPDKKERPSAIPTDEQVQTVKEFITGLIERMNIVGEVQTEINDGLRVNIQTEDSRIIGHRGEVLDSIQQISSSLINTSHTNFVHVTVDGLGYRGRRSASLESLARRMADKAVRSRRKVTLEPMNSADRRVIHSALGEREDVFTRSEGHEPQRRVVIIPKRR